MRILFSCIFLIAFGIESAQQEASPLFSCENDKVSVVVSGASLQDPTQIVFKNKGSDRPVISDTVFDEGSVVNEFGFIRGYHNIYIWISIPLNQNLDNFDGPMTVKVSPSAGKFWVSYEVRCQAA